jgi:phenylalanyl-tRNA synthetase beta chain
VLEALLGALRVDWGLERSSDPFLHPGKRATIAIGGRGAGWLGEIHPLVAADWEIDQTVAAFELNLDAVPEPPAARYTELPTFPDVREDLAVVVSDDVTAARVIEVVRRSGGELLSGVEVFDVYRDPRRLGEGNVSLALRLSFRASDRTLTDQEVAAQREQIIAALASELSGRVRAS